MTTTVATPTCEARTGFYPGEWSEMPIFCDATVGLTTWTDAGGFTHRACRHHRDALQTRYPREGCYRCGKSTDDLAVAVRLGADRLGLMCFRCQDDLTPLTEEAER